MPRWIVWETKHGKGYSRDKNSVQFRYKGVQRNRQKRQKLQEKIVCVFWNCEQTEEDAPKWFEEHGKQW